MNKSLLLIILYVFSRLALSQINEESLPIGKVYEVVGESNERFRSQVINAMEIVRGSNLSDDGLSENFEARCSIWIKKSKYWEKSKNYRNKEYSFGGNPALTVVNGVIYAVCMSVDSNYNGGSLELLTSKDNGKNWEIKQVVEIKKEGIPDRPSVAVTKKGEIYISYSEIKLEYIGNNISKVRSNGKILKSVDSGETFFSVNFEPFENEKNCIDQIICGENTISIGALNNQLIVAWGDYSGNLYSSIYKSNERYNIISYGNFGFVPPLVDVKIDPYSRKYSISFFQAHEYSKLWIVYGYDQYYELLRISDNATMSDIKFTEKSIHVFIQEFSKLESLQKNILLNLPKINLNISEKKVISKSYVQSGNFEYLGNNHSIILMEDKLSLIGFNWTDLGVPSLSNWEIIL